jgi:ADP-ribose pyrophosphatase YjhB (NUDIX family)
MDIKMEVEGKKFSYRSSCIIKDKEHKHIIVNNMRIIKDHEAFLLPGGRLNILENSYDAIVREIEEELGIKLDYKLISIQENIANNIKFHMLEFVFYAEVDSFDAIKTLDDGWDKFKIIDIENLDNYDIRPKSVKKLIKQKTYDTITHDINYDWAQEGII